MKVYFCIYSELGLIWYLKQTTRLHVCYCNGKRLFHMALWFYIRIRFWISCTCYPYPSQFGGVNDCLSSRSLYTVTKAVKLWPETYTKKAVKLWPETYTTKAVKLWPETYTTKVKLLQKNVMTLLTTENKRCQTPSLPFLPILHSQLSL
jgi:hypothetical protein